MNNKIIIAIIIVILVGAGLYFFVGTSTDYTPNLKSGDTPISDFDTSFDNKDTINKDYKKETEPIFGTSVEGREIKTYTYGDGSKELLFVGGIHGGYSWNTALVAYELVDYLKENPDIIPENMKVTVIPVLNPDGLYKIIGKEGRFSISDIPKDVDTKAGRFNANEVDLNRNFDCDWQATGIWQNKKVSGGSNAFSEPESEALRTYVEANNPTAVVVWYSSAGGVYASSCANGISDETDKITNVYSKASGYPSYKEFDSYKITGDMVNWLAKKNIPAISVLLTTHEDIEWNKNKAGIKALLNHYTE